MLRQVEAEMKLDATAAVTAIYTHLKSQKALEPLLRGLLAQLNTKERNFCLELLRSQQKERKKTVKPTTKPPKKKKR